MKSRVDHMMAGWAQSQDSVSGLALIGSRLHSDDPLLGADQFSDWDWQCITKDLQLFETSSWLQEIGFPEPLIYTMGQAKMGNTAKVYAVLPDTEIELVLFPHRLAQFVKLAVKIGLHQRFAGMRRMLEPLAAVNRPGFRFVKGEAKWKSMFQRIVAEVPVTRLNDEEIKELALGFAAEFVTLSRRLARGEIHSVQRLLHRVLVETNYRFLHELRLRNGQPTFPDARRLQSVADQDILDLIGTESSLDEASLKSALAHSLGCCQKLTASLLGPSWVWPILPVK